MTNKISKLHYTVTDLVSALGKRIENGEIENAGLVFTDENNEISFMELTSTPFVVWRGLLGDAIELLRRTEWGEND